MLLVLVVIIIIIVLLIISLVLSRGYSEESTPHYYGGQPRVPPSAGIGMTPSPAPEERSPYGGTSAEGLPAHAARKDDENDTSKAKVVDVVEDEASDIEELAKESINSARFLFSAVDRRGKMYDEASKNLTLARTYYNMGKYESSLEYSKKTMDILEKLSEGGCADCGTPIEEGWKRCPKCGKEVSE